MRTDWKRRVAAPSLVALVLVAAGIGGCEKGDVLAPADATLTLTASPSNIALDQGSSDTFADVTLEARIINSAGFPASEVEVTFSSTGGQFVTATEVETNGSGVALSTLRVRGSDPDAITATARSGSLTSDALITVNCPDNTAPVAVITITSGSTNLSGPAGVPVSIGLSGTSSTDAETEIAEWAWDCGNGTTGAASAITCSYTVKDPIDDPDGIETFTASLIVTDEGSGTEPFTCQQTSLPTTLTITVTRTP
jgi:hypothetical protein